MNGIPSLIYREGDGSVRWENERVLFRKWLRFEACSKVGFLGQDLVVSDLACTPNQLVFPLSIRYMQQRAFIWLAMALSFCHFGKNFTFWLWLEMLPCALVATKLTCNIVLECYAMYLRLKVTRTHEFGGLVHQNENFDCMWPGLCIMVKYKLWTWAKWNWLVHFAWNLWQVFLALSLARCKKNQVKRTYSLEMEIWFSGGLGHVLGYGRHVGPA